jgi:hypothetical protein
MLFNKSIAGYSFDWREAISATGLAVAIVALGMNVLKGAEFAAPLIIAAVIAMWGYLILYTAEAKKHHSATADMLKQFTAVPQDADALLLLAMRSGFLADNRIPPPFWAKYCELTRNRLRSQRLTAAVMTKKVGTLKEALQEERLSAPLADAYPLMLRLWHNVVLDHPGSVYQGVFTREDLNANGSRPKEPQIETLVFKFPQRSQWTVHRLFMMQLSDIQRLDADLLDLLREQLNSGNVRLRYLENGGRQSTLNVGIYGTRAVGELVGDVNTFDFNEQRVMIWNNKFHELFEDAEDLKGRL